MYPAAYKKHIKTIIREHRPQVRYDDVIKLISFELLVKLNIISKVSLTGVSQEMGVAFRHSSHVSNLQCGPSCCPSVTAHWM